MLVPKKLSINPFNGIFILFHNDLSFQTHLWCHLTCFNAPLTWQQFKFLDLFYMIEISIDFLNNIFIQVKYFEIIDGSFIRSECYYFLLHPRFKHKKRRDYQCTNKFSLCTYDHYLLNIRTAL